MSPAKAWVGTPPATCDLCPASLTATFVDGKTQRGSWANMCLRCHKIHGVGLGTGRGQRYVRSGDQFVKEEG